MPKIPDIPDAGYTLSPSQMYAPYSYRSISLMPRTSDMELAYNRISQEAAAVKAMKEAEEAERRLRLKQTGIGDILGYGVLGSLGAVAVGTLAYYAAKRRQEKPNQ